MPETNQFTSLFQAFKVNNSPGPFTFKSISTLKKAMIDALLGEDTRVLTADEELNSYFTRALREEIAKQEELSWDTRYRVFLENLRKEDFSIIQQARELPRRARVRRAVEKVKAGLFLRQSLVPMDKWKRERNSGRKMSGEQ